MLIEDALEDYFHYIQAVDAKSLRTVASYRNDLTIYHDYLKNLKISNMEEITYEILQQFLHEQKLTKKANSINHMITTIHTFHRYISFTYDHIANPSLYIRGTKKENKLPRYFNAQDIQKLLDSFGHSDVDIFHHAMLEILYGCGLRVSELCDLTLNHIHLNQGFLRCIGKGDKERLVPVNAQAITVLSEYLELVRGQWLKGRSPYVFINRKGNRVTRQYVHTMIKQHLLELGLDEKLSAHSFRHSFASHMLDGGADLRVVQELLGHSDIATTQIYTHIQSKRLKQAYTSFHPRVRNKENQHE